MFYTNLPLKEKDFKELEENVEQFKNFIVGMNLGENEIMKKVDLYRSYKEMIPKKLYEVFNENALAFLVNMCDKMILTYSQRNPNSMA